MKKTDEKVIMLEPKTEAARVVDMLNETELTDFVFIGADQKNALAGCSRGNPEELCKAAIETAINLIINGNEAMTRKGWDIWDQFLEYRTAFFNAVEHGRNLLEKAKANMTKSGETVH